MEYGGTLRIKNHKTLQKWINKGWFQSEIKNGYIFATACGRFKKEKCTCFKCRNENNAQKKLLNEVLKKNNLL